MIVICVLIEKIVKSDVMKVNNKFKKGVDNTICRWDKVFTLPNLSNWDSFVKYTFKRPVRSIWHHVYDNRELLIWSMEYLFLSL